MGRFKNKIAAFMYGRYGGDALNTLLLVLYLVLAIVGLAFEGWVSALFFFAELLLLVIVILRMMSRNIEKRRRENAFLVRLGQRIRNARQLKRDKKRDKNTHVYKKCPKCRAVLRLPKIKGDHTATCPKCKNKLKVRIR